MKYRRSKPKAAPAEWVNIHGERLTRADLKRQPSAPAETPGPAQTVTMKQLPPPPDMTAADIETVFDALCVAGWSRGRTPLVHLLRALQWRSRGGDGPFFSAADVAVAVRVLGAAGRVDAAAGEGFRVPAAALQARIGALLARPEAAKWWRAWVGHDQGPMAAAGREPSWADVRDDREATALLRLLLAARPDVVTLNRWLQCYLSSHLTVRAFATALAEPWQASPLPHLLPQVAFGLLARLDAHDGLRPRPQLMGWLGERLAAGAADVPVSLRLRVAECRLQAGDAPGMHAALAADRDSAAFAPAFDAAARAREGRWPQAVDAFAAALKELAVELGRRKNLVPKSLMQWHALALLAQADAGAWTALRKLALAQAGQRKPSPRTIWGLWAHAAAVRLGDEPLDETAFAAPDLRYAAMDPDDEADRVILAAWLGHAPKGWSTPGLQRLADALHAHGLPWKADLLAQAAERLGMVPPQRPAEAPPAWPVRFYAPPQEAWRDALAAITALGGGGKAGVADQPQVALRWQLTLDADGRVFDLQCLEPSATGRGKPKALSPLALKKRTRLDPRDAAVARGLRQGRYGTGPWCYDLTAAAQALVGHPDMALADAPGQAVELRETQPLLSVERQRGGDGRDCFVFRLEDDLVPAQPPVLANHLHDYSDREAEAERRNSLRIVRESPERARLLRITPAQRRVAELVAKRWAVPVDAQAELDAALRVLTAHFAIHSDAESGEAVPSDARLVAQLLPRGDAMELRLVVRPFGDFGPVLVPGTGRRRLLTLHQGLSLATERDPQRERDHMAGVLAALPMLGDEVPPDAQWLLEEPEDVLAAVQALSRLARAAQPAPPPAGAAPGPASAAAATTAAATAGDDPVPAAASPLRALEWPRGKPLRVLSPAATAMSVKVASGRDWFALDGELALDETRVLSLQRLLGLLREGAGQRFVALGEGEYLALTEQLRQRLAELDALAEGDTKGVRLPGSAAAWLADAADDIGASGDKAWRERARALEQAASLEVRVPAGLQAELRPYQAEGHAWMTRLAAAGFGACLADDMGLGKTVQTLALLLDRAALGPALVVAPTSVCANWAAEAQRFAPALAVQVYGEDGRAELIGQAGAGTLLVVSYALLLRDALAFAEPEWATLVLDEAQALKNAATQRAQAVGTLRAGFRLALSGTPVENRLADLWSVMNVVNPGLLGSTTRFSQRFATPIERGRDDAARGRLRRLVAPFLLRRTKAQVLTDLPPRTEIVHRVEPGPEEKALLEALRRQAVARVAALDPEDRRNTFNVLAELTRLRRAACDPRLAAPEFGLVGAKAQAFEELARELVEGRHQALVFSQFTDFLKLLAQRLDAAGLRYQYLDGSTPAAQRAQRVAAFQRGEGDLFLISLKAGGFGLNLTAADYVIIADPWWNPAVEDQAMGRAHRIGQHRPVTVYRLVTAGSIEERIVSLHRDKRDLADSLLADQDGGRLPDAAELMDLLQD